MLTDGPDALRFEATPADTETARETLDASSARRCSVAPSIEFKAIEERFQGGVREIHKARLRAIGIVDSSAYPESTIEARDAGEDDAGRSDTMRPWEWS